MKNLKRAATLTMVAGSLVAAGAGVASATPGTDAHATGATAQSPGVISGNLVQAPIDVPVQLVGNTVNVIALMNPTAGNGGYVG